MNFSHLLNRVLCFGAVATFFYLSKANAELNTLSETFVSATRMATESETVLNEINVLNKNDLEVMGSTNLTQALGKLPGIQSISYGSNTVYLRGTESRMTPLYIEGIRIESQDGFRQMGGVPWEMMPLGMVERIEVVKGPTSAVYGSDAMGGVVQLFGKRGAKDDRPSVTQSFASQGTKQTTGQISGNKNSFDYSLLLSTYASDGYNTRPDKSHSPSNEAKTNDFGIYKLGFDISNEQRVEWVGLKSKQFYQSVPYSGGIDVTNHNEMTAMGVQWFYSWNEKNFSKVKINQSVVSSNSDAPNSGDQIYDYATKTQTVAIDHELNNQFGKITGFVEYKKDFFNSIANDWNAAIDSSRSQTGYGLEYQAGLDTHRLTLGMRNDNYDTFGLHTSYALGYAFEVVPAWTLGVQQGTGYKAPTLEQLYGQYGKTSLSPETNRSAEIFAQYKQNNTRVRTAVFQNKISDLITSDSSFKYYNVDKVKIQGLSVSSLTKFDSVELHASLDLLDPVYETGSYAGKQLNLRSKQVMRLAIDKQFTTVKAGVDYQYIGKRFDDAANTVAFPAYGLVNLWTLAPLGNQWKWINRIDNLFDVKYTQIGCTSAGTNACNFAMPGLTVFTAIQWQPKN